MTSAAFPKKKCFLMDVCTTPNVGRNGLFWITKDESPSPGVAWTNPGWECFFFLSCTNFFLLSGENGTKKCYDPIFALLHQHAVLVVGERMCLFVTQAEKWDSSFRQRATPLNSQAFT